MRSSRGRRAAIILALLAALAVAGACGPSHSEPLSGDASRGQSIWAQSACRGCHGESAEGAEFGPALVDTPLSLRDVTGLVRRGTVNMPRYSVEQVSDQDLEDMFAWFLSPSGTTEGASAGECVDACPAPSAASAEKPWPQSPCAGCHGAGAEGGIGPSLAGTVLSMSTFRAAVREGRGSMPAFPAEQVSDQDLQALFDALQAGAAGWGSSAKSDSHPWVRAGCDSCHGPRAEGGSAGGLAGDEVDRSKLERAVREGEEGMPSYTPSQVSDADLQAIYEWLLAGAP